MNDFQLIEKTVKEALGLFRKNPAKYSIIKSDQEDKEGLGKKVAKTAGQAVWDDIFVKNTGVVGNLLNAIKDHLLQREKSEKLWIVFKQKGKEGGHPAAMAYFRAHASSTVLEQENKNQDSSEAPSTFDVAIAYKAGEYTREKNKDKFKLVQTKEQARAIIKARGKVEGFDDKQMNEQNKDALDDANFTPDEDQKDNQDQEKPAKIDPNTRYVWIESFLKGEHNQAILETFDGLENDFGKWLQKEYLYIPNGPLDFNILEKQAGLPKTQRESMSFKTFYESTEKKQLNEFFGSGNSVEKLKKKADEAGLEAKKAKRKDHEKAIKQGDENWENSPFKQGSNFKKSNLKHGKAVLDFEKAQEKEAEKATKKGGLLGLGGILEGNKMKNNIKEGVYAGADGVAKKIPFTQNPMLQNQAVGPKDPNAKDKKEDDKVEDAYEERKKKLEKISKELQALADEACDVAKDNIDATEDTLIDKMEAKERKSLKEGAATWEEMEKHLKQLEEGCVGGVCTLGGPAGNSGPLGGFGIAPMGNLGIQTQLQQPQANVPQVADRSTVYSFIKNNDLHRTSRDYALNALLAQFGNSQTELSQILSDAILSDGNPENIDGSYGFKTDTFSARFDPAATAYPPEDAPEVPQTDYTQQGDIAQSSQMNQAWKAMEKKLDELQEL